MNNVREMAKIISEHFGRADRTIEVVELSEGNITVIYTGNEAIIYASLYDMMLRVGVSEDVERIYCSIYQLSFIYENFSNFQDILHNFDMLNTKRK